LSPLMIVLFDLSQGLVAPGMEPATAQELGSAGQDHLIGGSAHNIDLPYIHPEFPPTPLAHQILLPNLSYHFQGRLTVQWDHVRHGDLYAVEETAYLNGGRRYLQVPGFDRRQRACPQEERGAQQSRPYPSESCVPGLPPCSASSDLFRMLFNASLNMVDPTIPSITT
jgi:hypothetical protein